jgi:hypothetical protein
MTASGCAPCGQVFGSLELFDAHQRWNRTGEWQLTCAALPGLVRDDRGTWRTPEGLRAHQEQVARLAAARGWHGPQSAQEAAGGVT